MQSSLFHRALAFDVNREYLRAVECYEQVLALPDAPVEAFANHAFIRWEAGTTNSGCFTNGTDVPAALEPRPTDFDPGPEPLAYLLRPGLTRYPHSAELRFWRRYFSCRAFFVDFSEADCLAILHEHPTDPSLVPYFFLSLFDEEKYRLQVDLLVPQCQQSPTAKHTWMMSVMGVPF